ncbi:preprotein translocase subunit SecE [Geomicrobium sp. JSM 1781026]|uniref:preprotein translocase subunit SecE n=1 Tax=unclassified Geomicrobium TaxID=2628951 RepID=UPI0005A903A7|nr:MULTISPECIES: preprotein translocase subunit SecE [unclassified Geomicrobium]
MTNPVQFLKEVGKQMKQVTWPTPSELYKYTKIVLITVIFMSIFFAVVDYGFSELVRLFL